MQTPKYTTTYNVHTFLKECTNCADIKTCTTYSHVWDHAEVLNKLSLKCIHFQPKKR